MKPIFNFFLVATVSILFSSCDPTVLTDWRIQNNTNQNIEVYSMYLTDSIQDYNSISPEKVLILFTSTGIGTPENELESITEIPFKLASI